MPTRTPPWRALVAGALLAGGCSTAGAMQQALGVSLLTLTIVPNAAGIGKYLVTRLGVATATVP